MFASLLHAQSPLLTLNVPQTGMEGSTLIAAGVVSVDGSTNHPPITVNLISYNTNRVSVASSAIIPPGTNSARFDLVLVDNDLFDGAEIVFIEAWIDDQSFDLDLIQVNDNESRLLVLTLPPQVNEGSGTLTNAGRISFSGRPSTNVVIALQSDYPELIAVPSLVTNLAGQSNEFFNLFIGDNSVTNVFITIGIRASAPGFIGTNRSVTVIENDYPFPATNPVPAHLAVQVPNMTTLNWMASPYAPAGTVYDVYFGTNPTPGGAGFLGSTSSNRWILPALAQSTVYYWQIVARAVHTMPSPVWQFTTRGLDHFDFSPVAMSQLVNEPFSVTVRARDDLNRVVTGFAGPVPLGGSTTGAISNSVPITPTNSGGFINGAWTGNITVGQRATNMILIARDTAGHVGQSNPFTTRGVAHFDFSYVATPQMADESFSITVTALDELDLPVTNFAEPVMLSASAGATAVAITPTTSGGFTNGTWTGNVTVLQPAASMSLRGQDAAGHFGQSNPFQVLASNQPIVFLSQPVSQTVQTGMTVQISVSVLAVPPVHYQWRFNGGNLMDETNATLTLTDVQTNQAGDYSAVVTNRFGSIASANATLLVLEGFFDDFEPGIDPLQWTSFSPGVLATNHGGSVSGVNSLWFGDASANRFAISRFIDTRLGGTVEFFLRLGNGTNIRWRKPSLPDEGVSLQYSVAGPSSWIEVARYDTSNYLAWTHVVAEIPLAAQSANTRLRWIQFPSDPDAGGRAHWALDDVGVNLEPRPTSFLKQPTHRSTVPGGTVTFSVTASGSIPLTYQWRKNGAAVLAATNATFTVVNAQSNDAGNYTVVLSNIYGMALSSNAPLTVVPFSDAVGVFDDPTYVDTTSGGANAESDNVQATVQGFGLAVVPFTNLVTAASNHHRIIIPAQERGLFAQNLSAGTRSVLSNFVFNGGTLIVHGNYFGFQGASAELLNSLFGFSIQQSGFNFGPLTRSAETLGTEFGNDPASISDNSSTAVLLRSSFPPGAHHLYTNSAGSAVVFLEVGAGAAVLIGWNWDNAAPLGTQDGGWLDVLHSALRQGVWPPLDTDGDGIPDAWEVQYGLNPMNAADALLDFDGDGLSNRDEFIAGTNPTNAASVLKIFLTATNASVIQFVAQSNVAYAVQSRATLSLQSWTNLTSVTAQPLVRTVRVSVPHLPPAGERFYRVVTPPPP